MMKLKNNTVRQRAPDTFQGRVQWWGSVTRHKFHD